MDENRTGANINTTPVHRLSEMAHTLVGKAVRLQVEGHGFKPHWEQLQYCRLGHGHHGKFLFLFFCSFFVL